MLIRDSPYNIRRKEKKITTEENNYHFISGFADWKGTKLEFFYLVFN